MMRSSSERSTCQVPGALRDTSKYDEETDNKITNKTHKICNKIIHLGHACYYLYRRLQTQKKEHDEYREIVNQTCR